MAIIADSSSTAITAALPVLHGRLTDTAVAWLRNERKISRKTLEKMPVGSGTVYFGDLGRKNPAIFFRYSEGWKARAYPEKAFTAQKEFHPHFWNLDAVLAGPLSDVYLVEGELDALALVEAGIAADQVLAAPSAAANGELEYVLDALKAGLAKAKRFIWCGDADAAGIDLRSNMRKMFGTSKFNFLDWPDGAKDANDVLRADGPEYLLDSLLHGFYVWPCEGVYSLSEIPDRLPLKTWEIAGDDENWNGWVGKIALAPGTLSIVTGHPGHGKTLLWTQLWFRVIKQYGLVATVASFEQRIKPQLRRQLRQLHAGHIEQTLSQAEIAEADSWINDHYRFLEHPERRPTLEWLLDIAETTVIRHGSRIVTIDPWNRLEASREPRESETDYIGRCLRASYNFAVDMNVHVQIVAHPAKNSGDYRRGDPPELEHIAGSKHWDNMPDQGFVVHRPRLFDDNGVRQTYCELHHKKARFDELGYATKLGLDFDIGVGRFGPCDLLKKKKEKSNSDDREIKADSRNNRPYAAGLEEDGWR